jgi:hypothetical protein
MRLVRGPGRGRSGRRLDVPALAWTDLSRRKEGVQGARGSIGSRGAKRMQDSPQARKVAENEADSRHVGRPGSTHLGGRLETIAKRR